MKQTVPINFKQHPILLIIFCFIFTGQGHFIKKIVWQESKVSGYTNQTQQFAIPFKKCFKVVPEISTNSQYMNFRPSSLQLKKQGQFPISQNYNVSLLQALRSPVTYKHKAMVILEDNMLMIYSASNKILVVKEQGGSFKLIDQYRIAQMNNLEFEFKLYKYSKNRSIMYPQSQDYFYVLDNKGYQKYTFSSPITISHLICLENDDILIAEFSDGLGHYRLNHTFHTIDLVKKYTHDLFNRSLIYITDVNYANDGNIYVLDLQAGMIQIQYDSKTKELGNFELVVNQSGCQSFDSIENEYFVLLCQIRGYSSIIQIDKKSLNNKTVYQRMQPIYLSTFYGDVQTSNNFSMISLNKIIRVIWNTKKNRLPEAIDSQSQIMIPGLQTFKLRKISKNGEISTYLYTVEFGKLVKYLLQESPPKLFFKPSKPIYKNMTIYLYGSCEQIGQNNNLLAKSGTPIYNDKILTCQIKQQLILNFQDQIYPQNEDFSLSASIIVLLILIFLVVIWICFKKYKGLQKQARKVLEVYKKKKGNQRREI